MKPDVRVVQMLSVAGFVSRDEKWEGSEDATFAERVLGEIEWRLLLKRTGDGAGMMVDW